MADEITAKTDGVVLESSTSAPQESVQAEPVQPSLPEIAPAVDPTTSREKAAAATEPAPVQEAAPAPQPEPVMESEPEAKDEPKTASEKLLEELEELSKERARLKDLTDRHLARERLQYLRQIGAKPGMPDGDLLALAPDADVTTPEGRAQIDAWRQHAGVYFDNRTLNVPMKPEEIAKGFKESKHGTFNQGTALKILQRMTGSKTQ